MNNNRSHESSPPVRSCHISDHLASPTAPSNIQHVEFFQAALDALSSHIAILDNTGTIVAVNRSWRQFIHQNGGKEENCGLGVNYLEVCQAGIDSSEEDIHGLIQSIQQNLSGHSQNFQLEYPCHNHREERWFVVRVTSFSSNNERFAVVAHENITQRIAAERQMEQSRRFLDTVIDNVPIPIFIKEAQELRFVRWNKAGEQLTGIKNQEMVGRNDYDFFPPSQAHEFISIDRKVLRNNQLVEVEEETLKTRNRGNRTVHVKKVPISLEGKSPEFLLGIAIDITERKQAAQKLADLQARLLDISRESGMAEVATGILHNVGNVLNSVNIAAAVVEKSVRKTSTESLFRIATMLNEQEDLVRFLTQDQRGVLLPEFLNKLANHQDKTNESILSELQCLKNHINHIKEVVSTQQGFAKNLGLHQEIGPSEIFEQTLQLMAGATDLQDIRIVKDYSPLRRVSVDKHRIVQILINLIRNAKLACHESRQPNKVIHLKTYRTGDQVHFSVSDNGIGIDPENLTKIFHHGFTTRKSGHGFGLHSAANAATEMGGQLSGSSQGRDQGAEFTLSLPFLSKESTE